MKTKLFAILALSALVGFADENSAGTHRIKDGATYALNALPKELTAQVPEGKSVKFYLVENGTTGYLWQAEYNEKECTVKTEHQGAAPGLIGAPGKFAVEITSLVRTPVRVNFAYRRSWEKDKEPAHRVSVVVYTEAASSGSADALKAGATYSLDTLPKELSAKLPKGKSVSFFLGENTTTGYSWAAEFDEKACAVKTEHQSGAAGRLGAGGRCAVEITSLADAPTRVNFAYRRPWEKDKEPAQKLTVVINP